MATKNSPESQIPKTEAQIPVPNPTQDRLKILKNEFGKLSEQEDNAEKNKDYKGLNDTLSLVKFVLSNNPSQEEIEFARKFISELKFIKDNTKISLENLKDEKILVDEIKSLLELLKKEVGNPETIDKNSNFEKLFSEIKSDPILLAKQEVSNKVNEKFKDLKTSQRENIKVAIISKITSSGIADSLVGGFSSKLKGYSDLLAKKNFTSLMKVFNEDKDSAKKTKDNAGKELIALLDGQITIIYSFVQKNKTNPNLETVLNSPKNIELIKADSDINSFKPTTQLEEQAFIDVIKNKIKGFDNKIQLANKTKETIFDQITKLPDFVTNGIAKFIAFFASIPFIGDFIKSFLGLEGKDEKSLEAELSSEFESRKSTKNLQEYGIQIGKNGEKTATKNDPKVKILEDKDLSSMKHKQLKEFFAYCKEKQVKTTGSDFWYNVFETKKIEVTSVDGDKKETKSIVKFNSNIDEKDFDANKKPQKSFFEKLNALNVKKEAPKPDSKLPVVPVAAAAAVTPAMMASHKPKGSPKTSPTPSVETPTQDVESGDLPKSIEFDRNTSVATIDGKKYKVEIKNGNYSVNITDFTYSNGTLNISGKVSFISGSTQFNESELKTAFSELKQNNKYEGAKNGKTLTITAIA